MHRATFLPAIGLVLLTAAGNGGCASQGGDAPPEPEAIEQARREERQKVLQQYWLDRTASLSAPPSLSPFASPVLTYPAGLYAGVRFAARQAQDPSLAEPAR
jgi:hypothetical protein